MDIKEKVNILIKKGKYNVAADLLDKNLSVNKLDPDLWYLRGTVSLKNKNYPNSLECFEHAISLKKKPEYFKMKGMALMEMFEFEAAVEEFKESTELAKDVECYFYIAVCYMFMSDPESKTYLEYAYLRDKKKTKLLLKQLYDLIFKDSWELSKAQQEELKSIIDSVK